MSPDLWYARTNPPAWKLPRQMEDILHLLPRVGRAPSGSKVRGRPCWRIHHGAHQRYTMLRHSPKSTESVAFATASDALWRDVVLEHRTVVLPFGVPVSVESNSAHAVELDERNF